MPHICVDCGEVDERCVCDSGFEDVMVVDLTGVMMNGGQDDEADLQHESIEEDDDDSTRYDTP